MKQKILIVDDEVSILQSLSGILQDEGYGVILAASGEEGLERVRKTRRISSSWIYGCRATTA